MSGLENNAPPVEPVIAQPQATAEPKAGDDDLDGLLAGFDNEVASGQRADAFTQRILSELPKPPDPRDREIAELRDHQSALEEWAVGVHAERLAEIDKRDAEAVFADARRLMPNYAPTDFEKLWFRNELLTNETLAAAWNGRHDSADGAKTFDTQVRQAMRRFKEAAERIPDPETTEDKALVAAAVRGASTKAPPPQKVDYSKLSDADFDTAVQQRHGFRPLGR